ncbi:restriction endonuclease subunit S [Vibrio crassostreae]|uniref:Type I restriction enzyme, S subunit n=2 Tax=Vibrio crassostreae TaxID=246167 RepID=A0A822MUP6_9VIBR|nr:restriction endonuclease subunit S [Vibrio crassostreae]MDH5952616.1 restriction endonuclease subunit S [Vibrio crassostreae]TCM98351.1 type I restriction enzyme S subunit [Vibrio crassostreae]TCN97881.1 type I restriction enzyme S subunit [Vibrio crassostreae]TCU01283.1 type I restriction enzyme S subunit [Vibrio crassostreae]CAK2375406.1 type I restriction enzyme, S subunit [Vibrio crassostreae]
MSCNWPQVKLGELVEITSSKRVKMADYVEKGVPFFRSKEVIERYKGNAITTELYITEEHYQTIKDKFGAPEEGHILLTSVGTLGIPYQVQANDKFYFKDGNLTWFKEFADAIDAEFLFYWLTSPIAKRKFGEITIGSTQKALTIVALKGIEIDLPPKNVQKQVVQIVKSLDKKLSNNRGVNKTLEQMAQTIFKSWFVDFDPVKAKMNGELPEGIDAATASLFPEKLVESELGLIPEGWEPKQLKDVLELAYGKALKKTDRVAGDVPVYGSGGLTGYHNQSLVEGPGIIVGRKGTVGSVYWEPKAFYPIDTVFYVKPKAGYSLKYCHLVLQNLGLKDMNTDAAVPGLNRNNAYRLDVITPSECVLKKFEEMMQSFQSKVDANNAQNASLESLRDTLLPKLLSGEFILTDSSEAKNV